MLDIAQAIVSRQETDDERALRRRSLTLALLTLTYFFSFMDRQILAILLEDIKADLLLSDTQLGMLTGLAFAVFYATLEIPVARLADRTNRRNIITAALTIWSAMTALCGLAQNFTQLLLARIGVGIGEAGSSPPSHSIIADLYPPEKRAGAMVSIGIPGVILAIFVRLFVIEPRRGLSDPDQSKTPTDMPSLREGFASMWRIPAVRHLVMGVTLTSLIGYALTGWGPTYYQRSFGLSVAQIAMVIAPILMVIGIISGVGGGKIADWVAKRWGLYAQSGMVALFKLLAFPFAVGIYLVEDPTTGIILYGISILFASSYLGPTFALIQGLAPVKLRALWAAITLLVINLIGLGIGPTLIGVLSDLLEPRFGQESLRYALLIVAMCTPWAIFHYWRAAVLLKRREEAAA